MATNVFVNTDNTNFPEEPVAWSVQADLVTPTNAVNPGPANKVFTANSVNGTPANTPGWTVQSTGVYAS